MLRVQSEGKLGGMSAYGRLLSIVLDEKLAPADLAAVAPKLTLPSANTDVRGQSMLRILMLQKSNGGIESATCPPQVHHIRGRTTNAYD